MPLSLSRASFPNLYPTASSSTHPQDTRTTVEEVEDEDDADSISASKKKKKKKPKKKRTGYLDMDLPVLPEDAPASPVVSPVPGSSPTTSPVKARPTRKASLNSSTTSLLNMSTTSLPLTEQTTAHSGHSYLQEIAQKEKIKSRPDHANLFSRGFLTRDKDRIKDKGEDKEDESKKRTWFSKLGKKTTGYMHQLLRVGDEDRRGAMKWENFLKVLRACIDPEEMFMRVHRLCVTWALSMIPVPPGHLCDLIRLAREIGYVPAY